MASTNTPAEDVSLFTNVSSLGTSPYHFIYLGSDITWTRPCRFLRAQTAGNVNYVGLDGTARVAKFLAGETRALGSIGIVASGTSMSTGDLEGMV
jgi:hypothetical protein